MKEIFNPDHYDLIRDAIIVIFGLFVRFFERRKLTEKE
jgi:hypothetical protein